MEGTFDGSARVRAPRIGVAMLLLGLLLPLTSGCFVFPMVPWPEFGEYALGMTYEEALGVTGDFTGGHRPPWPAWPPTSIAVVPPDGARDMRLVFTGQCVSGIETTYFGSCEDRLTDAAARKYGPPTAGEHGTYVWNDGAREVRLVTALDKEPYCGPACAPLCTLSYRLASVGSVSGPAPSSHGLGACRAMTRRHRVRWRDDSLHTIQRHLLDELGYLLGAGTYPMKEP